MKILIAEDEADLLSQYKEFLEKNNHSTIIKNLKQIIELMQKPFSLQMLVDTIEDKEIYYELEKLNVDIKNLKELEPTHAQVRDYLDALKKIQKGRTF